MNAPLSDTLFASQPCVLGCPRWFQAGDRVLNAAGDAGVLVERVESLTPPGRVSLMLEATGAKVLRFPGSAPWRVCWTERGDTTVEPIQALRHDLGLRCARLRVLTLLFPAMPPRVADLLATRLSGDPAGWAWLAHETERWLARGEHRRALP